MCFGGSNKTTSTTAPPANVSAAYNSLIEQAQTTAAQPYEAYSGDRVADMTPEQLQSMGQIQTMGNIAQPYIGEGAGYMRDSAVPVTEQALQPYMNPYQQQVIDATLARTAQADTQAQNQVTGNAALRGALGGDRAGIAQAELYGQQKLARDQTVAGLNQSNYTQALNAWQAEQARKAQTGFGISSLGTVAQNAEMQRLMAQLGIGDKQQQQNQSEMNVPYQNFLEQRAYPFQTSQWLAQLLGSATPALGSTTTTTGPKPSPLGSIIGAATTAAGVMTGNPLLIGAGVNGIASGGGSGQMALARGGRVGYAEGGPIMPLNPAAMPMNLGVGYVPASQIRAMPGLRPHATPQEAPEDPGMGRMTSNFMAAMKTMRGKEEEPVPADTTERGHYADGGGIEDVFNYYMPNPNTDPMTIMDREWERLPGNWMPPTSPEWNTPTPNTAEMQPAARLQPSYTRPDSTELTPVAQMEDSGVRGPVRSSPSAFAPSTWNWDKLRMPLITAGLGMMASKSPFPMQAIGEGGLMGVQTYMTQEQQARANELKKRQVELQSQRLSEAADRARESLTLKKDQLSSLNDYRDASLTVRQNTSKQGVIERLAERVATELNIPFNQALERVRASNRDPQTMLSLERLALQAAKADDLAYKNDPKSTLARWRKDYGLPEKPAIIKGFDKPEQLNMKTFNDPTMKGQLVTPDTIEGKPRDQVIAQAREYAKLGDAQRKKMEDKFREYGIPIEELDK